MVAVRLEVRAVAARSVVLAVVARSVVLVEAAPLEAAAVVDHSVAAEAEVPSEEAVMAEVLTVEDTLADAVNPLQLQNAHLSIHHPLYFAH